MLLQNDRAFKEWAVVRDALRAGRQTVLVRKGGIREEDGVFAVNDPEFFLLPTYDHQNAALLQPRYVPDLDATLARGFDPRSITIDTYATVDTVRVCGDEAKVNALADEFIWNPEYVRMRFDYNAYDPVYVLILRAYRLSQPQTLPMRADYGGCKSWVTLDRPLSTAGAVPAIADAEFARRRAAVLKLLG